MKVDISRFKDFEVADKERETSLKKIQAQAKEWGITIPDVTFLMVNFGLNDFFNTGETETYLFLS
ncbi:MAG: hypothetical protein AB1798_09345 [Spirochaetota bacterium]